MGVRAAQRRSRTFAQGAHRRRRRHRDSGNRAARASRRFRRHRRECGRGSDGTGDTAMMRLLRSAFVIGRRHFGATVLSKTFIFFLLGPVFPLLLGGVFGSIGSRVATQPEQPVIAVVSSAADFSRMEASRDRVSDAMPGPGVVRLVHYEPESNAAAQQRRLLMSR